VDVNVLEPALENTSSSADSRGEGPNLAIAATAEEETPVAGIWISEKIQLNLMLSQRSSNRNEDVSSRVKLSRPEDSAQAVDPASAKREKESV